MNPQDESQDEQQIESLLKLTQPDAPPPDADMLARLRAQSTDAFAAAARWRSRRAARWLASAAAAIVVAAGLYVWLAPGKSNLAFGKLLESVETAKTAHVNITNILTEKRYDFWHVKEQKCWRMDADGHYRIGIGSKYWIISEENNLVRPGEPRRTMSDSILHVLSALSLVDEPEKLLAAEPVSSTRAGATEKLLYRLETQHVKGVMWVEAAIDSMSQRLTSLTVAWQVDHSTKPVAELRVVAYDEPIKAEAFAIADTLTEDGRIGKVAEVQGVVGIKPVLHERWTPLREGLVLKPGDWVRTDARGANATALRLVKDTRVILGPKTLVELIGPTKIRLIEGEVEITPTTGRVIELFKPGKLGGAPTTVKIRQIYRVEKQQVVRVEKNPPWLLGFKGATTNETLGSLVALVDGRNVPLTVGYHKVTVDIRDQIARTVIEESFVNHTKEVLEGVFHFPLPQDASISGFGMWIGDNYVEADVVEKQRAREIYETILREKRDPGLLEWSGGNLFKARVYPIPAHGEKRIKITYTQVLPLKGNRYRFSYALQSDLLKLHPLRELSIDVKINSVTPLKSVSSPTHPTRDDLTSPLLVGEGSGVRGAHAAHVEFAAQEYTPSRDFEVVVELDKRQSDVVLIPHRRGDDGYFMLQLTPPGPDGNWDRAILPNGDPLHLLILTDTSASIDAGQRATQAAFIAALLGSLTPKDTFNLACCDVTCDWTYEKPRPAESSSIDAARYFLAKRPSLGWTDLDAAFASALKQAGPKTHVIYVGDGIPTTRDADPVAFTKRLGRLWLPSPSGRGAGGEGANLPSPSGRGAGGEGANLPSPPGRGAGGEGATCHAVSLGSTYESGVLKAIASLGSGSMRKITSDQGPATVARELLAEISEPGLRDIKVEFKGIKVARLYPESVPNIAAGTQQILLGRFLPSPLGRGAGGEGELTTAEVIVTGTQAGKPVRFSTPVSLKDAALGNSFIPRLWARLHLDSLLEQGSTETIRDEIISLSEEFHIITPYTSLLILETDADRERFKVKRRFLMRDGERFFADGRDNAVFDLAAKQMKRAAAWRTALRRSVLKELAGLGRDAHVFEPRRIYPAGDLFLGLIDADESAATFPPKATWKAVMKGRSKEYEYVDRMDADRLGHVPFGDERLGDYDADIREGRESLESPLLERRLDEDFDEQAFAQQELGGRGVLDRKQKGRLFYEIEDHHWGLPASTTPIEKLMYSSELLGRRARGPYYGQWLNTLFPPLAGTPREEKEPKSKWPAPALALVKSLLRTDQLAKMPGAIEIVRQSDTFEPRWDELTARSRRLELFSAKAWLTRSSSDGGDTLVSWCDAKEIGVFSKAFQLGRVRAPKPRDVQPPPLELQDHSLASLHLLYARYMPAIEPQGKDRTLLILKYPSEARQETRILIDTARHVILSIEERRKEKVVSTTKFDDFVEAGGSWWAQRIETLNDAGQRTSLVAQTIKPRTLAELDQQVKAELAGRADAEFLHLPLPSVAQAKKTVALNKASFEDRFVLLYYFEQTQQWPRVLDHLQAAEKLVVGKPGLRWLRSAVLLDARRHEELRLRYDADAARLAKSAGPEAYYLAQYLVGAMRQVVQANEMLALLGTLKPLYDKQPAHVLGRRNWLQERIYTLRSAGRRDEMLAAQKQLAIENPREYYAQAQYARDLAQAGDYPAAYAWLTRVLVKAAKWNAEEEDSLRSAYATLLEHQGRYADAAGYLAAWVAENPPGRSAYEQYLTALLKSDQLEKLNELVARWVKESETPKELPDATASRLHAAVNWMLGEGSQVRTNRIEERWLPLLGQTTLYFARRDSANGITGQIVSTYAFQRSDEGPTVRKKLFAILAADIGKLRPDEINRFLEWVGMDDAPPAAWDKIAASLRDRWQQEAKDEAKHELGRALVTLLSRRPDAVDLLAFLRLQFESGPAEHRDDYARTLFDRLLAAPWNAELEAEALGLLNKLATAAVPGTRLWTAVAALHHATDRLLDARVEAATRRLVHSEKLTRTELLKKHQEIRKAAREGLADRLRLEAGKQARPLADWLTAEGLYLDVPLDRHFKDAMAEAWAVLGAAPPAAEPKDIEQSLSQMLRHRYFVMLMNLAARKSAPPGLADRLGKYVDEGIKADGQHDRWKAAKYQLLIALDRIKEIEQALGVWTRQDDPYNRWRIALGYLLAEQGKLADAIRTFEAVEADDELSPKEYRTLADWYLTQQQREKQQHAADAVYRTMPEGQLHQLINARLYPWTVRAGRLPTTLDPEVLRVFRVLFAKSERPAGYLDALRQFYQASHDFRLLSMLPDAVLGHTAEGIYPFIAGMLSVLDEVRDEATADEMVKRIAEVRPSAKTAVDQRALDLLEALLERRAAEVRNQPGPHAEKALAALQRAFKREWAPGEPRLMADFLNSLAASLRESSRPGQLTQQKLADETLRQFKALSQLAKPGSLDRLHIATQHAMTLRLLDRGADAMDLLQPALDEFRAANNGVLPAAANQALTSYIVLLKDAGHFARAENLLQAQLGQAVQTSQRHWLIQRLDELYHQALDHGAEVSLGKVAPLYQALAAKVQKDLADPDQTQRYNLLCRLIEVHGTARRLKLAGVKAEVKAFAFEFLPPLLKAQADNHDWLVTQAAELVHGVLGPRDGVAFLLNEIEQQPRWLRYTNQDGWSRHSVTLATWRVEAKNLGDLEPRLLKLALAELRRDLETRESTQRHLYNRHVDPKHFWKEKADDFAKTAEAVLAQRSKSSSAVQYIAHYFYWGLDRPKRAIEILLAAHNQKVLDESGQATLVDFLHRQDRYGESIAILQPLIQLRPTNLEYRVELMHAYFRTAKKAELLALLKDTDAFFHQKDRWTEYAMSQLADSTLKNGLYEQSIAYFTELVPLHERTAANRGIGDGELTRYYVGLANAYAGLKKTPEAVEAAGAAVVAWGPRHDQRAKALDTLKEVLLRSADLDAFVKHLDQQKQDSAIIRKALGRAFQDKKDFKQAIRQYELAAALQPNDAELYAALVECHDQLGDEAGAIKTLRQAVHAAPRELKLYQQLGERLAKAGQANQAERAFTSIVEMLPLDAESHALLAEIREKQDRWADAIVHWEQVARLRALEPTGLLKLAAAQLHEKQWDSAAATIRKLNARSWPARFSDVRQEIRKLEEQLAAKKPRR